MHHFLKDDKIVETKKASHFIEKFFRARCREYFTGANSKSSQPSGVVGRPHPHFTGEQTVAQRTQARLVKAVSEMSTQSQAI